MASTFAVTRNHLIFGLCLPLAILLGYLLADARDPASQLIILTDHGGAQRAHVHALVSSRCWCSVG
jgi:hypothetical protein